MADAPQFLAGLDTLITEHDALHAEMFAGNKTDEEKTELLIGSLVEVFEAIADQYGTEVLAKSGHVFKELAVVLEQAETFGLMQETVPGILDDIAQGGGGPLIKLVALLGGGVKA